MRFHRSAAEFIVQTPAKLNLFLEVLGKRDDGYHEIETLICPIDLYDTLYFKKELSGRIELQCERLPEFGDRDGRGTNLDKVGQLPQGGENLVVRAVELLRRRAGVDFGANIRLVKRIPMAAGLGGGSSDAAAALVAANEVWDLGRSPGELALVAAELGSDVPFFIAGGAGVCRGRGELVKPLAVAGVLDFVLVHPPAGLSTAVVYDACRPAPVPETLRPLQEALLEGKTEQIGRLLFNRLRPAAESLSPWIRRLERAFSREDFLGYGMSGSGTSYFGLCRHAGHARRVARRLQANGAGSVFAVRSCR